MKGRHKLAIALGAASIAGVAFWPQFGFSQASSDGAHDSKLDRIVSKRFENANVNQVFAWLVENGFSYIVRDRNLDTTRVSLNIDHQSVWDAAEALADALGGHWTRDGHVYVFHKDGDGLDLGNTSRFVRSDSGAAFPFGAGQSDFRLDAGKLKDLVKSFGGWQEGPGASMSPEDREKLAKKMEQWSKDFAGKFDGKPFGMSPDMEKKVEEKMQDLQNLPQANLFMPQGQMSPEDQEKFAKKMEEWSKEFAGKFDGKSFEMSPDMEKKIEEKAQSLQNLPQANLFMPQGKMSPEDQEKFEKKMEDWSKNFSSQFDGKTLGGQNFRMGPEMQKRLDEAMKGLSQRIQELLKSVPQMSQGKLSPDDQRKLQKGLEELSKSLEKGLGTLGPNGLDSKDWEEFAKKWEDWGENWGRQFDKSN